MLVEQYSNRPAPEQCVSGGGGGGGGGGAQKLFGGRFRSQDQRHSECLSNLMNILLQNLCYPSLVWTLLSNLEVKTKKIKKDLHHKILVYRYLITFTCSVMLFHRKKPFVVTCHGQKFARPLVLVQKFALAWGPQAVIWWNMARNAPRALV